jgi:lipopolysaccharide cholinephosphotransferase
MIQKHKVIIFGTGKSFSNYISHYRESYDFIGVTDWEYEKHGEILHGLKVINPFELHKYEYNYILIASYYVNEIKEQLQKHCNIDDSKIILPLKYQLKNGKPFEDDKTRWFARDMVFYFTKLARCNNIILYLDYGTLLGFVRNGDIIEWDDDVDFSINERDVKKFATALKENKNKFPYSEIVEWTIKTRNDTAGRIWYFSIWFKNKERPVVGEFEFGIRVRKTFDELSVVMKDKFLACDSKHFTDNDNIEVQGNLLYLPKEHSGYLDFVYGSWKEPKVLNFGFREGNRDTSHLSEYKKHVPTTLIHLA